MGEKKNAETVRNPGFNFYFCLMGCVWQKKLPYPKPINEAQKLANYVVEKDYYYGSKYRYHELDLYDYVEKDGDVVFTTAEVKVVIDGEEKKLIINESVTFISDGKHVRVAIGFIDENIDGKLNYYKYTETENQKIIEDVRYENGKMYKNEEWVDALEEEESLLQTHYNGSLILLLVDLKKEYKAH